MPARKGKAAKLSVVHQNKKRYVRPAPDWFEQQYKEETGEDWVPTEYNPSPTKDKKK